MFMTPWLLYACPILWLWMSYDILTVCLWLSLWLCCHGCAAMAMLMVMMVRILPYALWLSYDKGPYAYDDPYGHAAMVMIWVS